MSGIFKKVRAFFNWAYKTKIIDSFTFEGFEMPSERYGSPYLHPLPHDRHRHEEGSCEDFGGKAVMSVFI